MAELLGFRNGIGSHRLGAEVLPQGAIESRWFDEVVFWNVGVAVILHHAGIKDIRDTLPVELVEIRLFECPRDFDGPVSPEIEQYHRIAVFNGADGLAVLLNHK